MPRAAIDVKRTRCQSCGDRTGCCDEDAKCHGCSLVLCYDCTEDYGHGFNGPHGIKSEEKRLQFAAQRAEGLRERDRRWSRPQREIE